MTFLSTRRPLAWAGAIFFTAQVVSLDVRTSAVNPEVRGSFISIYHDSSVRISVVDPRGRRVEGDPRKELGIKEIETSNYLDESTGEPGTAWAMYIWGESGGRFLVTATGIKSGPFSMDIQTCDEKRRCALRAFWGVTEPDRRYTYAVDFYPEQGERSEIRAATYDFKGLAPLDTSPPPVIRRGEDLNVSIKVVRRDGKPVEHMTARLLLRPRAEDESVQEEPLNQREPIDLSRTRLFRYNPVRGEYECNMPTGGLTIGSWVLVVLLDDGSVEKGHFELKLGD